MPGSDTESNALSSTTPTFMITFNVALLVISLLQIRSCLPHIQHKYSFRLDHPAVLIAIGSVLLVAKRVAQIGVYADILTSWRQKLHGYEMLGGMTLLDGLLGVMADCLISVAPVIIIFYLNQTIKVVVEEEESQVSSEKSEKEKNPLLYFTLMAIGDWFGIGILGAVRDSPGAENELGVVRGSLSHWSRYYRRDRMHPDSGLRFLALFLRICALILFVSMIRPKRHHTVHRMALLSIVPLLILQQVMVLVDASLLITVPSAYWKQGFMLPFYVLWNLVDLALVGSTLRMIEAALPLQINRGLPSLPKPTAEDTLEKGPIDTDSK